MSGTVLTLVAPAAGGLSTAVVEDAASRLQRLAGGTVVPDDLSPGQAVDLRLPGTPPQPGLLKAIRGEFQNLYNIDVFVQPLDDQRRKRLLVADMDATIVVGETLDDLAAHLGLGDQVAPITARAMRGELDFAEALDARVGLLKGMPLQTLETVLKAMQITAGAEMLVRSMAAQGARCVLASGGFEQFTGAVAARLGFHAHFGNRLAFDNGMRATGEVLRPLVDKDRKKKILEEEAAGLGIPLAATLAVGDGANDIPLLQTAGLGVAYHAKPIVLAATPYHVRYGDLSALLFMQGYRRGDWAAAGRG